MTTALLILRQTLILDNRRTRRLGGLAITTTGLALLAMATLESVTQWPPAVQQALMATLGTALATGLGALPVLFMRQLSARRNAGLLGFGGGVMLAATVFSLALPGIAAARATWAEAIALPLFAAAVMAGAALLTGLDRVLPHSHFTNGPVMLQAGNAALARRVRGLWLFVFAIALHNLPEGLAVGVSAGSAAASPVTIGIGLQNLPEGLVVAMALVSLGYRAGQATLVALATGLVEPVGGVIGASLVQGSAMWLPVGLGLAAGAMLYAVIHEVIPEARRGGHENAATTGLLLGFAVMAGLDVGLG